MSFALAGCQRRPPAPAAATSNEKDAAPAAAVTTAPGTPRELLDKVIDTYRAAKAYSDYGVLKLSYRQDGELLEDSAPLTVDYAAPNRLRVQAYQVQIAIDGKKWHAKIRDAGTNDLDGQILERAAPDKLALDELYRDSVLRDALASGLGRYPVQLELLFGDAPLLDLLKPEAKIKFLDEQEVDGHRCQRLGAVLADGAYVFWFDLKDFLLRRIEYPVANILPALATAPGVTEPKLVADLRGAQSTATPPDSAFALEILESARRVRYFVLPPQSLPSELFGKQPPAFALTNEKGEKVTSTQLAGKVTALLWVTDDPGSQLGLEQLQLALAAVKNSDKLAVHAVAAQDGENAGNLAERLPEWKVSLPLWRDSELAGRDIFRVRKAPTLVVLNAQGVVQVFQEGADSRMSQTLPVILERLLAGDDVAAQVVAAAKKEAEEYTQDLARASDLMGKDTLLEIQPTEPVAKRLPQTLKLTELWSTADKAIAQPGNLLAIPGPKGSDPQLLVIDGGRTVVQLDIHGKVLHAHQLDFPDMQGITFLRTTTNKAGERLFVGSSQMGRQLYLFDDQWRKSLAYPPLDEKHDGLHAVEIADLDDDGTPELYVGYWSLLGVQQVTLSGQRIWGNRLAPTVLSLAVTPPGAAGTRQIIVAGDRGTLYRLNHQGQEDPKIEIAGRQVHRLAAAQFGDASRAGYCGISYQENGRLLALGLDAELKEIWSYPLPAGQFQNQIEFCTSGALLYPEGEWYFAGPDGSVHVICANGEKSDSFALGELLTGLAVAQWGETKVILTATKSKVTAWKVEP